MEERRVECEVDVVAGKAALADEHSDLGRDNGAPKVAASITMRASRGGSGKATQPLALLADAANAIDGAECAQQSLRFGQRRSRRWIEEGEPPGRLPHAARSSAKADKSAAEFPAAKSGSMKRSAVRPMAGSRMPGSVRPARPRR